MKKIIMLLFVFICVGTCFGCVEPPNPSDVYFDVTIDFDNGEQISTIKVKKGECVGKPDSPQKSGYVFNGWAYGTSGREFDFSSVILSDVYIKAVWKSIEDARPVYKVNFYAKDGTTLIKTDSVRAGDSADAPFVADEKFFNFSGWSESVDAVTEDKNVTAVFTYASADAKLFEYELTKQGYFLIKRIKDDAVLPVYDKGAKLALPLEYNGVPVIGIADAASKESGAFYNKNIESVYIPSCYTKVGAYSFYGNPLLSDLNMCEGVTFIGKYAFAASDIDAEGKHSGYLSSALTRVIMPSSVYSIDEGAFDHIGAAMVDGMQTMLSCTITFAEGCRLYHIGAKAFCGVSLVNLTILPQGEIEIGDYAFAADTLSGFSVSGKYNLPVSALKKITLGRVKDIGDYAFFAAGNGYLKTKDGYVVTRSPVALTLDSKSDMSRIGDYAFCFAALTGNVDVKSDYVGKSAFYMHSLSQVRINEVTEVQSYAFATSSLTEYTVSMPDAIKIAEGAFKGSAVTKAVMSTALNYVGASAFEDCKKLSAFDLGNDLTGIGDRAFYGCGELKEKYEFRNVDVGKYAFAKSGVSEVVSRSSIFRAYAFAESELASLSGSVSAIGEGMFMGCSKLMSVELPHYERKFGIPAMCFYGCSALTQVKLSESVNKIGDRAFYGCSALKDIALSVNVEIIEPYAFALCSSLTTVVFESAESGEQSALSEICDSAFSGCKELTAVNLPSSVTIIGNHAFSGSGLTSFVTPVSLRKMGYGVFYQQSYVQEISGMQISKRLPSLTKFVVAKETGKIEFDKKGTFDGAEVKKFEVESDNGAYIAENGILYDFDGSVLIAYVRDVTKREITIKNGVVEIAGGAFSGNALIKSVTFPSSLRYIDDYAFFGCVGITSITVPSSVERIGAYAFSATRSVQGVAVELNFADDAKLTEIGESAFAFLNLKVVEIPSEVLSVGDYAFFGCKIERLQLQRASKLQHIGKGAFSGIKAGAKIKVLDFSSCDSLKEVGEYAFAYSAVEDIIFGGITHISDGAFYGCVSLDTVKIGEKVSFIGKESFRNCFALTDVIVPENNVLSVVSAYAFAGSDNAKMSYVLLNLGHTKINSIGEYAFAYSFLRQIELPNTPYELGEGAFFDCDKIESVQLGECVSVGESAFWGASSLKSVELPGSLRVIGKNAFSGLNLQTVMIGNEANGSSLTVIGKKAFFDCKSLVSVDIYGTNVPKLDGGTDNKSFFVISGGKNVKSSVKIIVDEGMKSLYLPDVYVNDNGWQEYSANIVERDTTQEDSEVLPPSLPDGNGADGRRDPYGHLLGIASAKKTFCFLLPTPIRGINRIKTTEL